MITCGEWGCEITIGFPSSEPSEIHESIGIRSRISTP